VRRDGLGAGPWARGRLGDLVRRAFALGADGQRWPRVIEAPAGTGTPAELAERAEDAWVRQDMPAVIENAGALLRCDAESTRARSLLGRAYLAEQHAQKAVACFFSALRGHEDNAQLWLDVGAAMRATKENSVAVKA